MESKSKKKSDNAKRPYKKPVINIVNIENENLLAGSGEGEVTGDDYKGNSDFWDDSYDSTSVEAKFYNAHWRPVPRSLWDD